MNLLITGGSGALGKQILREINSYNDNSIVLSNKPGLIIAAKAHYDKIIIFSRDEHKQIAMRKEFPEGGESGIRYFIGDVRNKTRLKYALKDVDFVIHAAALKSVPDCEYNCQEAIDTNITGSRNVIEACIETGVKKCIMVSTDKAVHPINLYGTTKLCMEKVAISSNNLGKCRFSVVRYGNVESSTSSVIPLWKRQIENNEPITITDKRMTRFWISLPDAAKFVLSKFDVMEGGEIFVPKLTSKSMVQLATDLFFKKYTNLLPESKYPIKEIGIRPGEKLHEVLISEEDCRNCFDDGDYYTIYPSHHDWTKGFIIKGKKVKEGFTYCSNITT